MTTFNITCSGPGPHIPTSGILGTTTSSAVADVRCSSAFCVKPVDPSTVNQTSIQTKAQNALAANLAYIGSTPTQAQAIAQVMALTKQVDGLIRLALQQFDSDT